MRCAIAAGLAFGLLCLSPTDVAADHANRVLILELDYLKAQYDKGRRLTPIDLRSRDEFSRGHLPGAHSLPLDELTTRFHEIPTADLVVLYCDCTSAEAEGAYRFLREQRYRNVSILGAGFKAWEEKGYPIEH